MTRTPQGIPLGPGQKCLEIRRKLLAKPSQAYCDWGIRGSVFIKLNN